MADKRNTFDNWLNDQLGSASIANANAGWDAFAQRRKRRAWFVWWSFAIPGAAVIFMTIFYFSVNTVTRENSVANAGEKKGIHQVHPELFNQSYKPHLNKYPENAEKPEGNNRDFAFWKNQQIKKSTVFPVITTPEESKNYNIPLDSNNTNSGTIAENETVSEPQNAIVDSEPNLPFTEPKVDDIIKPGTESITDSVFGAPLLISSQNKKYSFSIDAGPAVVNPSYIVSSLGQKMIHKDLQSIRNRSETGALGFQVAVNFSATFGRWQPLLGLGFTRMNIIGNYNFDYTEYPVLDVDGTILGYRSKSPKHIEFTSHQSYSSIQIPMGIQFTLLQNRKWEVSADQMWITQVLQGVKGATPHPVFLDEIEQIRLSNMRSTSYSWQSGLRFTRSIKDRNSVYLRSAYSRNFGIIQSTGLYKTTMNSFSVNFGFKRYFGF